MTPEQTILTATIVGATVVGIGVVPRLSVTQRRGAGVVRHPGTWLAVVVLAMAVNQVLVTAYIHQVWDDDTSRITRYLPPGWFDLADLGRLDDVLPAWPWTVLHVQAALELPFVMLAYLCVARWFGPEVFGRVVAARWWISASWTLAFSLIEWDLHNPYTVGDIVIRVVSGVVTPILLPVLASGGARPGGLLTLALSAAALGCLVLAAYDVLTLYNLAHLRRWAVPVVVAGAVLAVTRWWASRPHPPPRPVTASAIAALGWFVVVFAVPSLPVRYGFTFGAAGLSAAAGLVTVVVAIWLGWGRRRWRALCGAVLLGAVGAVLGASLSAVVTDAGLLGAAVGFVVGAAAACTLADRRDRTESPDAEPPPALTQRADRSGGGAMG